MKENTYTKVAEKMSSIGNNQPDQYRALIAKLLLFRPNNWPKFQEQLKKLLFVEISPTETEKQIKESIINTHTTTPQK